MEPVMTTDHPQAQCIDLRATFAGRFKFEWDPAYEAERPEFRTVEAPWLTRIPGTHGYVYPYGGRRLAAYSKSQKRRALEVFPGVTVLQGGTVLPPGQKKPKVSIDLIVTFDVDLIEEIAALLGLRPARKRASPERVAAFRERMRPFQFQKKTVEDSPTARPDSTNASQAGGSTPPTDETRS